jgi:hypothetical protein
MKIIAHRGNLHGPNRATENKPATIIEAISKGFDVEIDVWMVREKFWLGHDGPETPVTLHFLVQYKHSLWIHCKDIDTLVALKNEFNCFFHDKDAYTLTSRGFIWGNVGSPPHYEMIQVMPERAGSAPFINGFGVCTVYPFWYR